MDGIVLLNKPAGITSYDVIRRLKKIFNTKKIGHGGTLDPFADGLLVIAINQGTKIISYFLDSDKGYIAKLKLGEKTDSYDLTGEIIESNKDFSLTKEAFIETLNEFKGKTLQTPPMHSAKKVNGQRLYKLARKGIEIERGKVEINITELDLVEYSLPYVTIKVACKKGTYIRSLANDIGDKLGSYAHLVELTRTKSGHFSIDDAYTLDELEAEKEDGKLSECLTSLNDALSFMPSVTVHSDSEKKVLHGVTLCDEDIKEKSVEDDITIKLLSENGALLALAQYHKKKETDEDASTYKYKRVFLCNN
ncbi:tRNA pseudouridine(55) synthase TruB [Thermodesulfobacteriota bacterium]